eukprot:m.639157 g.639157  ORF g.639157 m.639157 type:complete len:593 (-) comp58332_c0_seq12:3897-5675(-)
MQRQTGCVLSCCMLASILALVIFSDLRPAASRAVHRLPSPPSKQIHTIPNVVHFVRSETNLNEGYFGWSEFTAIRAAHFHLAPDSIFLHIREGQEPSGLWFDAVQRFVTIRTFSERDTPRVLNGVAVSEPAHISDFRRLQLLDEEGGIYIDTDVWLLRPLSPLLTSNISLILGQQINGKVNVAFMACEQNSWHVRSLRAKSLQAFDGGWISHSVSVFSDYFAQGVPDDVLILPPDGLNPFSWLEEDIDALLYGQGFDWSHSFAVHLFHSKSWMKVLDFPFSPSVNDTSANLNQALRLALPEEGLLELHRLWAHSPPTLSPTLLPITAALSVEEQPDVCSRFLSEEVSTRFRLSVAMRLYFRPESTGRFWHTHLHGLGPTTYSLVQNRILRLILRISLQSQHRLLYLEADSSTGLRGAIAAALGMKAHVFLNDTQLIEALRCTAAASDVPARHLLINLAKLSGSSIRKCRPDTPPESECAQLAERRLDDYWQVRLKRAAIDILVLDASGPGLRVLDGAQQLLEHRPPSYIFLQFQAPATPDLGKDMLLSLMQRGYALRSLLTWRLVEFPSRLFDHIVSSVRQPYPLFLSLATE